MKKEIAKKTEKNQLKKFCYENIKGNRNLFSSGKTNIFGIIVEFTKYIDNNTRKIIELKNVPFGSESVFVVNLIVDTIESKILN